MNRAQPSIIAMSNSSDSSLPSDIRLLLRADAERHWLHREVIPVLREVETLERPREEVGAALAYLEAMWNEASLRARETDAAHNSLHSHDGKCAPLSCTASRYHAAVRVLRGIVADRVLPLVDQTVGFEQATPSGGVRVTDKRSDGCAPRAA
jgi:hypothetical protein